MYLIYLHLFNKGHAIAPIIPPLKDEDEAGYQRGRSGKSHIELKTGDILIQVERKNYLGGQS